MSLTPAASPPYDPSRLRGDLKRELSKLMEAGKVSPHQLDETLRHHSHTGEVDMLGTWGAKCGTDYARSSAAAAAFLQGDKASGWGGQ